MVLPLIFSAIISIGCAIGSAATTGVTATLLAATAVSTAISAINNAASPNTRNNFEISTNFDCAFGNGDFKISSKLADALLPKRDTVLLYDSRNSSHERIFLGNPPSSFPSRVYDVDTGNTINFQNKATSVFDRLNNNDISHLFTTSVIQEWQSPAGAKAFEIFKNMLKSETASTEERSSVFPTMTSFLMATSSQERTCEYRYGSQGTESVNACKKVSNLMGPYIEHEKKTFAKR
jgi:hypothetical protein